MTLLITFAVALIASIALTPLVLMLATKYNLVDHPDPERKLHASAIPLGGGVAVFLATLIAVGAAMFLFDAELATHHSQLAAQNAPLALLLAATILVLVGLLDDATGLRGRQKLFGQFAAVAILIYSGLVIRNIQVLEWNLDLGLLAIPFTAFWLLGAINALNLLDGADGFATTIGVVICGTLAALCIMTNHPTEAIIALAMTGALIGFLIYNFPPASIFLGDAGSMLIGLVVGTLAIETSLKGPATVALAAPMAILAIPIFDSLIAVLRRVLTGRSLYQTDRGHLHHSLQRRGLGPRMLVIGIALLCFGTASGALLSTWMKNEQAAWASVIGVLGVLVVTRVFGFSELAMAAQCALRFSSSLLASNSSPGGRIRQESVRLQGSKNWDELWDAISDFAEMHDLSRARLDLNLSWLHEGYHAVWSRDERENPDEVWIIRLPLVVENRTVGRLQMSGPCTNGSSHQLLALISELIEDLQPCFRRLTRELTLEVTSHIDDDSSDDNSDVIPLRDLPHDDEYSGQYDPTKESV